MFLQLCASQPSFLLTTVRLLHQSARREKAAAETELDPGAGFWRGTGTARTAAWFLQSPTHSKQAHRQWCSEILFLQNY